MKKHQYRTFLRWTGNSGQGTATYQSYRRRHEISGPGKATTIAASSDAHFRGDADRYNPEELLVAALSSCHMLAYLHLCAAGGVVVTAYEDDASGEMVEDPDGGGHLTGVVLRPRVTVTAEPDREKALHLHEQAGNLCFIARSVRFPVTHEPVIATV
ncbi:MAG: OsmC family protein [Terriglobia bacterium]